MGSGGFILGGALQGIGAGLVQQGQQQAATAAATAQQDAAMRREIALENLRAQNNAARDKSLSGLRMDEQENAGRIDDWKAGRQVARTTDSSIKIKGVETASQIQVDNAKSVNDAALARLNSTLKINETQAAEAARLAADLALAGQQVGEFKVAANGQLVAYSKTGQVLRVSQKGLFRDPEDKSDTAGLPGFPGAPAAAAPASAAPRVPANRPPLSSFEK